MSNGDYTGEDYLSPEALDEVRYQIGSCVEGMTQWGVQLTKFESGERAGLEKALEIIDEYRTKGSVDGEIDETCRRAR